MTNPLAPLPSTERFSASPTNYRASTNPVAPIDGQPQEDQIPLPPPPAPPIPQQRPPQAQPNVELDTSTIRDITPQSVELDFNTVRDVAPVSGEIELDTSTLRPARNFRNVYQDQELARVAQEFYRQRDGDQLSAPEAVSRFVSDRTWKQANTGSALIEFGSSQRMAPEQSERLRYLKDYWDTLPDFYQTGGRGGLGVVMNLAAGASDPVNALGVVGRGLGTLARLGRTALVDAGVTAATNVAEQATDINIGRRTSISPTEAAIAGGVGALASVGGNALAIGANRYMRASTGDPTMDAQRDNKIGAPPEEVRSTRERFEAAVERNTANYFDQWAALERPQRDATGVGTSPREMRDAYANASPNSPDPINGAHYQARMLAASAGRVDEFLMRGGTLPPDATNPTIAQNQFDVNVSPAMVNVYEPFNRTGQTENFNMYLMALNARWIRDVVNPTLMREARAKERATGPQPRETPLQFQQRIDAAGDKARRRSLFEDSQVFLDTNTARTPQEAQLYASQSIDKWIAFGDARPDFVNGKNQFKQVAAAPLEYQRRSGIVAQSDVDSMTGAHYHNPNNVEFVYVPNYLAPDAALTANVGGKTNLSSSPGRARAKGGTGNRMDVEEAMVDHIYRAVTASDKNRMKLALYDNITEAVKKGNAEEGQYATRVKFDAPALLQRFYNDPEADAMLRRAGVTTDKNNTPPDEILRVMVLNDWRGGGKDNLDIVFRNGKAETWRINDPELLKALKQESLEGTTGKALEIAGAFARYRSAVIMANPVTMVKNAVRDTTAAGISSPFTFVPLLTTAKGAALVFKHPILRMLQKASDKIPGNPGAAFIRRELAAGDAYRRAWVAGMGYSGQIKNAIARGRLELSEHKKGGSPAAKFFQAAAHYMHSNVFSRGLAGWLEFSNNVEMASRMGEFQLAKAFGMSDVAAAYMAREVATDFGQRGTSVPLRVLMNSSSFLSATTQSFHKLAKLAARHPGKILGGMAAYAVFDAAMHAVNSGHPSYTDQPEHVRAQNVLLPIYVNNDEAWRWITGQQTEFTWQSDVEQGNPGIIRNAPEVRIYIPAPKPFEFGAFGTLVNGIMDSISTMNGNHIRDAFMTAFVTAVPGFKPPDMVEPFWNIWMTNRDGLGRPVTPEALNRPEVPGLSRYTERTAQWARDASQSLANVVRMLQPEGAEPRTLLTPIEIEFLANHLMPGVMGIPLQALTAATYDEGRTGARPTLRPDERDITRSFSSILAGGLRIDPTSRTSPALNQLYEIKARADALVGAERLDETDLFRVLEFNPNNISQERIQGITSSSTIRDAVDAIRHLTLHAQTISTSTELTPEQKRLQLDANLQERNDTARNILQIIQMSNLSDRLMATFFNDPRNDLPRQNIIRQTIENFRRD